MDIPENPCSILLVEDSEDDVFFFRLALRKCDGQFKLHTVHDGQAAIHVLSDKNENRFDVIFLDLKLPFVNGFEVLKWIRGQDHLRELPVYVLSGSSQGVDKDKAMKLGATDYFEKPIHASVLRMLACPSVTP